MRQGILPVHLQHPKVTIQTTAVMTGDAGVRLPVPDPQSAPCLEMSSPSLRVSQFPQHTPSARSAPRNQPPNLLHHLNLTMIYTTSILKSSQSLKTYISVVLQLQGTKMPKEISRCATPPITPSKRLQRRHLLLHPSNTQYQKNPRVKWPSPPRHLSFLLSRAAKL